MVLSLSTPIEAKTKQTFARSYARVHGCGKICCTKTTRTEELHPFRPSCFLNLPQTFICITPCTYYTSPLISLNVAHQPFILFTFARKQTNDRSRLRPRMSRYDRTAPHIHACIPPKKSQNHDPKSPPEIQPSITKINTRHIMLLCTVLHCTVPPTQQPHPKNAQQPQNVHPNNTYLQSSHFVKRGSEQVDPPPDRITAPKPPTPPPCPQAATLLPQTRQQEIQEAVRFGSGPEEKGRRAGQFYHSVFYGEQESITTVARTHTSSHEPVYLAKIQSRTYHRRC